MLVACKKTCPQLVVAILGAVIGSLTGEFVWALICALGAGALACVAQNLFAFAQRVNSRGRATLTKSDSAMPGSIENRSDWVQKWNEDMDYCPTYKGTPGNIWRGPKWSSDD